MSDESVTAADTVISGVGAVPNTRLAEAAGLWVDNGIVVDQHLATTDPDIFAAGVLFRDVVQFYSGLVDLVVGARHHSGSDH